MGYRRRKLTAQSTHDVSNWTPSMIGPIEGSGVKNVHAMTSCGWIARSAAIAHTVQANFAMLLMFFSRLYSERKATGGKERETKHKLDGAQKRREFHIDEHAWQTDDSSNDSPSSRLPRSFFSLRHGLQRKHRDILHQWTLGLMPIRSASIVRRSSLSYSIIL